MANLSNFIDKYWIKGYYIDIMKKRSDNVTNIEVIQFLNRMQNKIKYTKRKSLLYGKNNALRIDKKIQ